VRRFIGSLGLAAALSCSLIAGVPESPGAPAAGEAAPEFTLPGADGEEHSLAGLLETADHGKPGWLFLVFYRGYW